MRLYSLDLANITLSPDVRYSTAVFYELICPFLLASHAALLSELLFSVLAPHTVPPPEIRSFSFITSANRSKF